MYKILGADQKEYGPVSADQVRQWISEGRINRQSSLHVEGGMWKAAGEYAEFAPYFPIAAPPIPVAVGISMVPQQAKSSPLAIWSLSLGILAVMCCCCGFPIGIVSIVLGIVALSQIGKTPGLGGRGFAITGIVLGSISILLTILSFFSGAASNTSLQDALDQLKHLQ